MNYAKLVPENFGYACIFAPLTVTTVKKRWFKDKRSASEMFSELNLQ